MFRELRRKDKAISDEKSSEIIKNGDYGILSVVGQNGYAYGVPLNYTFFDNSIYFHSAMEGFKLDNLRQNDRVSFCVVGKTKPLPEKFSYSYESVIVFGRAQEIEGEEKERALFSLIEKYSNEHIVKGKEYIKNSASKTCVVKISIDHVTGKAGK